MDRRTKIVATIGPASQSEEAILRLLKAGVNVARLNLSHGTHSDHQVTYERLRQAADTLQIPICIMMDLQGPKIRIGSLPDGERNLHQGQPVILTVGVRQNMGDIPVDFPGLPASVHNGGLILLDDGNIELRVEEIETDRVKARVVVGGLLKSHKGISIPQADLNLPSLTSKDLKDLKFGLELGVDAVAISFVRTEKDILYLRETMCTLSPGCANIPIIAKLERPSALEHLDEIIQVADGAMVARGDLGVEMSPQDVPIAQKRIIECANSHARTVITATQMLESMIHKPRPTRAEASDVANAIFDGTDAVMLSGETAIGEYPIESVEMMDRIICKAEAHVEKWGHWHGPASADSPDDSVFISLAVRELAHDRNVAAIAVFTMTGRTALHVSKTRPSVPILAFTPEKQTYHRLGMYWGVTPHLVPRATTAEEMLSNIDTVMKNSGKVLPGQQVVVTCGFPVATTNPTNLILLHSVHE